MERPITEMQAPTTEPAQHKEYENLKRLESQIEKLGFEVPDEIRKIMSTSLKGNADKPVSISQFTKEFISFAGDKKPLIAISVILSLIGQSLGLASYLFGAYACWWLYEHMNNPQLANSSLITWGLVALACLVVHFVFISVSTILSHKAAFYTLHKLRLALFKKIQRLPQGYMVENTVGKLKSLIIDRVASLEDYVAHLMPEVPGILMQPLLSIIILFLIDWRLPLALLVPIIIAGVGLALSMRQVEARQRIWLAAQEHSQSKTQEYIEGMPVIKAFLQTNTSFGKLAHAVNFLKTSTLAWYKNAWIGMACMSAALATPLLACAPLGFYLFSTGKITMFGLALSLVLPLNIISRIMPLTQVFELATAVGPTWSSLRELLQQKELARPADSETAALDLNQGIKLEDISFSYQSGHEVLHHIDLHIEADKMTALVGPSGSGKSTIARLIASFWDVDSGTISLGGVNIKDISHLQLMQNISYVAQDTYLFDGSIADNIRIGKPQASDKEVLKAAELACCSDFIARLPQGINSQVGENGVSLSGGERQRISLARALLKDAPIIVLDEATAYTDPESEHLIQEALLQIIKGKTLLVVAHRLNTVMDADKIVVLNKGRIECSGTHKELQDTCPLYRKLWKQFSGEEIF